NNTGHNFGRFRLSATNSPRPVGLTGDGVPSKVAEVLNKSATDRSPEQTAELLGWYKTIDPQWRALKKALDDHEKTKPKPNGIKALSPSEGLPPLRLHTQGADFLQKTHLLRRGDPNQKGEEVQPSYLQVLMTPPNGEAHWKLDPPSGWRTSYRRASLAN